MLFRLIATTDKTGSQIDLSISRVVTTYRGRAVGTMLCFDAQVSTTNEKPGLHQCETLSRMQGWLDDQGEMAIDTPANVDRLKEKARRVAKALIGGGLRAVWVESDQYARA
jgi:hypothetical protein